MYISDSANHYDDIANCQKIAMFLAWSSAMRSGLLEEGSKEPPWIPWGDQVLPCRRRGRSSSPAGQNRGAKPNLVPSALSARAPWSSVHHGQDAA